MKRIYFYTLLLGLLAFVSCAEDTTSPVLKLQKAAEFQALSQTQFAFTKDNATTAFPTIAWDKVDYGVATPVMYDVTLTNNGNSKSVSLGETGDAKLNFTNGEMNAFMAKIGGYPGKTYDFTISLVSKSNNYTTDPATNTLTFKATTYDPKAVSWKFAYVAVGYPDWDYTTAYLLGDPDDTGAYRGYADFAADGATYAIIDGSDVSKVLASGKTTKKGFCEITIDADGTFNATDPIKWGVIGDATSGGWSTETAMEYDADTRLWTVVTSMLDKEYKFRGNNNWDINYGAVSKDVQAELTGDLKAGGENIKVAKEHAYIITLSLADAGKYTYSMEETDIEQSSTALYMPGNYQGWAPDSDDIYTVTSPARDFKFSGIHYFAAATEFAFLDGKDWSAPKLALNGFDDLKWNDDKTVASCALVAGGSSNIKIDHANYYRVELNQKKLTCTFTKAGWEVIGDATPGAWDNGTVMNYDPDTKLWSVEMTFTDGEYKFRWNAGWDLNLGGNLSALTEGGGNIAITAGTYVVELNPTAKTAKVTKK